MHTLSTVFILLLLLQLDIVVRQHIAIAKEIYVHQLGHDIRGDGSACNPFRTLEQGIASAEIGDTVVVEEGTALRYTSYFPSPENSLNSNAVVLGEPWQGYAGEPGFDYRLAPPTGPVYVTQQKATLKVGSTRRKASDEWSNTMDCFTDRSGACKIAQKAEPRLSQY